MKIQESGETYLETILLLQKKNGFVRSIDIANELDYTKPSISRAMGILKKAGYVQVGPGGQIILTELGTQKAGAVYERHRLITRYLALSLDLSEGLVEEDACRIEHVVSESLVQKMRDYVLEREKA